MSEAKPSNPRVKSKSRANKAVKATKVTKAGKSESEEPAAPEKSPAEKSASQYPVFDHSEAPAIPPPAAEEPAPATDWPEPEMASSGEATVPDNPKRKRRRKKGKGGQQNAAQSESDDAPAAAGLEEPSAERAPSAPAARQSQPQRPKLDAEMVSKLAWKIYLAEVSEEGVALIGDSDARELSRRCFRLAEIFIEEQSRRR